MSEAIEWPVSSEVLNQLGQMLSKPNNPISIFGPIHQLPYEQVKPNSDILREKGIKDAVGNLSPAFHRVLGVLSDPEALLSLRLISGSEKREWLVYFGRDLNQKILYSILPEGSFIADPFSLDRQIEIIQDWTGGSSLRISSLELSVSMQEAMIIAIFIDLFSDQQSSVTDKDKDRISFNLVEIGQAYKNHKNNQNSLTGILVEKKPEIADSYEIEKILDQMVEKGFCQLNNGRFSFSENLEEYFKYFLQYENLFLLDLFKFHRTSGHLSQFGQIYVQKGVRNMLVFDFLEDSVLIKCISPKELINNYIFIVQEKIFQIPDPQPEVLLPIATIILNSTGPTYRLLPQNGNQPIEIKEMTKIGRHPKNQVVISEPSVSRWHAQLEIRGGDCWITDLGSSNGSFVNEIRIQTTTLLRKNDRIRIGPLTFIMERFGNDPYATENTTPEQLERIPAQYCSGCGKPTRSGARFCDQCGTQLIH